MLRTNLSSFRSSLDSSQDCSADGCSIYITYLPQELSSRTVPFHGLLSPATINWPLLGRQISFSATRRNCVPVHWTLGSAIISYHSILRLCDCVGTLIPHLWRRRLLLGRVRRVRAIPSVRISCVSLQVSHRLDCGCLPSSITQARSGLGRGRQPVLETRCSCAWPSVEDSIDSRSTLDMLRQSSNQRRGQTYLSPNNDFYSLHLVWARWSRLVLAHVWRYPVFH